MFQVLRPTTWMATVVLAAGKGVHEMSITQGSFQPSSPAQELAYRKPRDNGGDPLFFLTSITSLILHLHY